MSILQDLLNLNEGKKKKAFKLTTPGWYVVDNTDLPVDGPYQEKGAKFKAEEMGAEYGTLHFSKADIADVYDDLDEAVISEDDGQYTMDELVDKYFDKVGPSLEGHRGLARFARLCSLLGYKDRNYSGQLDQHSSVGDITNFLEDNPGALEAMVEFIKGQRNSDWESSLKEFFDDDSGEQQQEAVEESAQLDEKVFDEDKYTWYAWANSKPSKAFERRGGAKQIERGMQFGLRPATSKPGTWRLILKSKGPSIIFSIPADEAKALAKAGLELK